MNHVIQKPDKWQNIDQAGHRPLVKICGLTQVDNALDCVKAGADAIGLVFFEKSPRNVSMSQAQKITRALEDHVLTCGVFVDANFEMIMKIVTECGLKAVQLHGKESPKLVNRLSMENLVVIKALFAARQPDLSCAPQYPGANFCLVEYGKGILPGGNAETWNYGLASSINTQSNLMLAGGLSLENIVDAISQAKPRAVDVSSGVETAPGLKDINKVKAFIRAAKA